MPQYDDPRARANLIAAREAVVARVGEAAIARAQIDPFDPSDDTTDFAAYAAKVAQIRGAAEAQAVARLQRGVSVDDLLAELGRAATLVEQRPSSNVFGAAPAAAVPVKVSSMTHPTPEQLTGGLPTTPPVLPGHRPMPNAVAASSVDWGVPAAASQASPTPTTGISFGSGANAGQFHANGHQPAMDPKALQQLHDGQRYPGTTSPTPLTPAELALAQSHALQANCPQCHAFLVGALRGASGVKARNAAAAAKAGQHSPTPAPMVARARTTRQGVYADTANLIRAGVFSPADGDRFMAAVTRQAR